MTIKTVFYDMDGVMCNWHDPTCRLFGTSMAEIAPQWEPGCFELRRILKVSDPELWAVVDRAGQQFWANLELLPGAKQMWELADEFKWGKHFLTCPSAHPSSSAGKVEWLAKFTGNNNFRDYIFTKNKHFCAGPDRLLIDDSDDNVNAFRANGGHAILYPALWNSEWKRKDEAVIRVLAQMREFGKWGV